MRGAGPGQLRKGSAAGAALLLICLGLSACGGSSGQASTAASGQAGAEGRNQGATPAAQKPARGGEGGASGSGHKHQPTRRTGASAFIRSSGDNSIPEYGAEGSGSQKAEAGAALAAYLSARQAQDWGRACSLMGATVRRQVGVLAKASGGKAGDCARSYRSLAGYGAKRERADVLSGPLAALRVKGEKGFALFYGPHHQQFMMPMVREGGRWKVNQPIPIAYPIGAPVRGGR